MLLLNKLLGGLLKIDNISTNDFNKLLSTLLKSGWHKTYEYDEFDAWIDYGKVVLKKGTEEIVFEWDNWSEGSIDASEEIILSIKETL